MRYYHYNNNMNNTLNKKEDKTMEKYTCYNCNEQFVGIRGYLKHLRDCLNAQVKALPDKIVYLPDADDSRYNPATNTGGWKFLEWRQPQ